MTMVYEPSGSSNRSKIPNAQNAPSSYKKPIAKTQMSFYPKNKRSGSLEHTNYLEKDFRNIVLNPWLLQKAGGTKQIS